MRPLALALCLCSLACGKPFSPESEVNKLRVLGVRATPAELHPGETTTLEVLVVDGARPGQKSTVLWLGCDPDPYNLGRNACSDATVLKDPGALEPGDGSRPALPPGMHVIGLNDRATYTAPKDLFDVLPADDARRQVGSVAQVLALAVAEEVPADVTPNQLRALLERVRRKEVAFLITLFRVRVSEQPGANQNPGEPTLRVDGEALPPGATLRVRPEGSVELGLDVAPGDLERYVQLSTIGAEEKTESVVVAFYSSFGRFDQPRLRVVPGASTALRSPGSEEEALPARPEGTFFQVLRDTRGGQSWSVRPLFLCDPQRAAPRVSAATHQGGVLTLQGASLDAVLEVWVGGKVAPRGAYSASRGLYEADLPALEAGEHEVRVRGKHCDDETLATPVRL